MPGPLQLHPVNPKLEYRNSETKKGETCAGQPGCRYLSQVLVRAIVLLYEWINAHPLLAGKDGVRAGPLFVDVETNRGAPGVGTIPNDH